MTSGSFQSPGNTSNEERLRVLSEYATDLLFQWLTRSGQEERAREYMGDGAPLAASDVRLAATQDALEPPSDSEAVLSDTALRLSIAFGEDSPVERYDIGTWPGFCAFDLSALIDWQQLADRLLRRYVPEYAPAEARTTK